MVILFFALLTVVFFLSIVGKNIAIRFPDSKRTLTFLGYGLWITFLLACTYAAVWFHNHPPSPPKPPMLPKDLNPPALDQTAWTVYMTDQKEGSSFSMALPAMKENEWIARVWERYDDRANGKTILTLSTYDCEIGVQNELYDVYYDHGAYDGYVKYSKDDSESETKIDLETVGGSAFLLACYGKMPSRVMQDN